MKVKEIFFSLIMISTLLIFASKDVFAQTTGVGAGVVLGAPTGIDLKFWTSNINAFDVVLGWTNDGGWERFGDGNAYYFTRSYFHFQADYLWHDFTAIRTSQRLPLYYGVGFQFDNGDALPADFGVRGVVGLDWMPYSTPLDVFLEVAPVLYVVPSAGLGIDAGIGARFFFH